MLSVDPCLHNGGTWTVSEHPNLRTVGRIADAPFGDESRQTRRRDSRHLNLAEHPREDLVPLQHYSLAIAFVAIVDVRLRLRARSAAVRADQFPGDLELQ